MSESGCSDLSEALFGQRRKQELKPMLKREEQEREIVGLIPGWETVPESSSAGSGRSLSTHTACARSTDSLGSRKIDSGLLSKLGGLIEEQD